MFFFVVFVFFQAEDGIRDLVRSRGLGDVYKRQPQGRRSARPEKSVFCPAYHVERTNKDQHTKEMKELWLCTRQYPKGRGEAFLQHALPVWKKQFSRVVAVSYTHLTLPTSNLV